ATDEDGHVVSAINRQYDSFGSLQTGASYEGYSYTGREWDPEVELYYYRARYYDPKISRFLSEDPVRSQGGINLYVYVGNDPANQIDPSGMVVVNRGPTTMHMKPSAFVGPYCAGHLGCTDTRARIDHECYAQGGCWHVEFTVSMSIDMWVSNDLLFASK